MSDLTLRPASPTFEDGLVCARFANVASEGFMEVLFGHDYERIIATAFLEPDHDTSYQNVTFAEQDGKSVGMILAYSAASHRRSSIEPQRRAAGPWRLRMRLIETFLGPFMRLNDSIEDNDYYLQFIAVDQSTRTAGVGTLLLDEFESQARACGASRLSLDVSVSNDIARKFYENRGWTADFEWPDRWFLPALSVRMSKPL